MDITEKFPEKVLVKIMESCSGKDLLNLTETCKTLKNIISKEASLMMKIQLNIQINYKMLFDHQCLEDLRIFTTKRKFTSLKLMLTLGTLQSRNARVTLKPLFWNLSKTVDDLSICQPSTSETSTDSMFQMIIGTFLPTLKNLEMENIKFNNQLVVGTSPSYSDGNGLRLNNLQIKQCDPRIFASLSCCRRVEDFTFLIDFNPSNSTSYLETPACITAFLRDQRELKVLNLSIQGFGVENLQVTKNWSKMSFQLRELTIRYQKASASQDCTGFINFLEEQKQMEKLTITLETGPSRKLMKAICGITTLKVLNVDSTGFYGTEEQLEELDGLFNQSVKSLALTNLVNFYGKFCEIFEGVESIEVDYRFGQTLSTISHSHLPKIKLVPGIQYSRFIYEPSLIPNNQAAFEQNLLQFFELNSQVFTEVCIQMPKKCFVLTCEFYKSIISVLQKNLKRIEVFKVAEVDKLKEYMNANYPRIELDLKNEADVDSDGDYDSDRAYGYNRYDGYGFESYQSYNYENGHDSDHCYDYECLHPHCN